MKRDEEAEQEIELRKTAGFSGKGGFAPNTPVEFLQKIVDGDKYPQAMRLEAAKALLPYTTKKMAEEIEYKNSTAITDERLKILTEEELNTLHAIYRKLTDAGSRPGGSGQEEVQPPPEILPRRRASVSA